MILLASAGKSNAEIARDLHTCDDTVRLWRRRWISSQATSFDDLSVKERLEENPRSGRPPRITAEQTCQLVAIACTPPSDHPTSHWTPRELAEEVMARGIIDQISSRLLKRGLSNPI
jgi:transposase-like protein